jgi:Zn-dependent protease with chaperone function
MAAPRPEHVGGPLSSPAAALRTAAALAMLGLVQLGGAALAAGCLAVVVAGWGEGGLGVATWAGVAGLLIVAALVTVGLVLRDDAVDLPGVRVDLDPHAEAAVWAEVRAAAGAVGTRVPDRVFLVPGVTAFVTRLPWRRGTAVGLGMGLLTVTRVGELRAVLAHELGHRGAVDGAVTLVLVRGRRALLRGATEVQGRARRPLRAYAGLFARLVASTWRGQELAVDARAVQLCGRDATARGIKAAALAAPVFDHLIDRFVAPMWAAGRHPADLYGGLRALLLDEGRAGELRRLDAALRREPTSPYGTHPALGDRLAAIAGLPDPAAPFDHRPARALLSDPDTAERLLTERLTRHMTGLATTPVSWAEAAATVFGPAREHNAAALGGLDELLLRLARGGPGIGEPVRRALGDAVASELARRGGGWVLSWVDGAVPAFRLPGPGAGDLLDAVADGVPGSAAELRRRIVGRAGDAAAEPRAMRG